jgi:hypothetical protein
MLSGNRHWSGTYNLLSGNSDMKGYASYLIPVALLFTGRARADDCALRIPNGAGSFVFVDPQGNADRPITVYTYRPQRYRVNDPILFVMHGVLRNGREYRDQWIVEAERFGVLLIAPEFSAKHYPGMYNQGNMFDDQGKPVDPSKWTFSAIEHLFDRVNKMIGGTNPTYYLYGHSAGAQFVHRLVIFRPDARVQKAVAANAGWYVMPNDVEFPYGLKRSGLSSDQLRRAFRQRLVILLAEDDTDENDEYLLKTPAAMAQGSHRVARGRTFFREAHEAAHKLAVPLHWELKTVPGVKHDNAQTASWGAKVMFEQGPPPSNVPTK